MLMELYYILMQTPPSRHILCERAVNTGSGFWLYRYEPRLGTYVDDGYARDLGQLRLLLAQRYGWFQEVFLIKGEFERAANFFVLRNYPRVIYLLPHESFCVHTADTIFSAQIDGSGIKVEEWIGGEKPKSLKEALEALSSYAQKTNTWVIFKHGAERVEARLAIP